MKQSDYELMINYFRAEMPNPQSELNFENNYQLVVAVVLSAQCTDKRVNMITPSLFERYPDFYSLAKAEQNDVYELIKSCTYPNNKSKNLIQLAEVVVDKYDGILPDTHEALVELPGVGRKTANVVMAVAYNKPYFAVDTHVHRVANRIGLTNSSTPLSTEKQLLEIFPSETIPDAHHWLLLHGRYRCKAQRPKCDDCGLSTVCKYFFNK